MNKNLLKNNSENYHIEYGLTYKDRLERAALAIYNSYILQIHNNYSVTIPESISIAKEFLEEIDKATNEGEK